MNGVKPSGDEIEYEERERLCSVEAERARVEKEDWKQGDADDEMQGKENAVAPAADRGESRGHEDSEKAESRDAQERDEGSHADLEDADLDEEVHVPGCVQDEKRVDDSAGDTVPGIELLVRGREGKCKRGMLAFHGQHVVDRELGCCDNSESFRDVKVVWTKVS